MAAWTEYQRASIRKWLGFGNVFLQADPRAETAMTAVLAVADGGTRPTSDAQNMIIQYLTALDGQNGANQPATGIEGQKLALLTQLQVGEADKETKMDALRALVGVAKIGRFYVRLICYSLGFKKPLVDVFADNPTFNEDVIREPPSW